MAKIPVVNLELQRLALSFTHPLFFPYARFDIDGAEQHPDVGPGDHRRQPPQLLRLRRRWRSPSPAPIARSASSARRRSSTRRSSARSPQRWAASASIAAPARDEPLKAAAEALERRRHGGVMPQGTIPRGPAFFEPRAEGSLGCGAPGGDDRRAGDPRRAVGHRAGLAAVGAPAERAERRRPARRSHSCRPARGAEAQEADADTHRIMKAIMALLPDESRVPRAPTADELAATLPPGARGTSERARDRRPGTD